MVMYCRNVRLIVIILCAFLTFCLSFDITLALFLALFPILFGTICYFLLAEMIVYGDIALREVHCWQHLMRIDILYVVDIHIQGWLW